MNKQSTTSLYTEGCAVRIHRAWAMSNWINDKISYWWGPLGQRCLRVEKAPEWSATGMIAYISDFTSCITSFYFLLQITFRSRLKSSTWKHCSVVNTVFVEGRQYSLWFMKHINNLKFNRDDILYTSFTCWFTCKTSVFICILYLTSLQKWRK